jgi:hypothetical protein
MKVTRNALNSFVLYKLTFWALILATLRAVRGYKANFALYNMIPDAFVFTSEAVDISIFERGV